MSHAPFPSILYPVTLLPEEVWSHILGFCDPLPSPFSRLTHEGMKSHIAVLYIQRCWRRCRRVPRAGSIVALYPRRGPDTKKAFVVGIATEASSDGAYQVRSFKHPNRVTFYLYGPRDPRFRVTVLCAR